MKLIKYGPEELYSDFYTRFCNLIDEFDKKNFALSKKRTPFIHDLEEENMMDTVLNNWPSDTYYRFLKGWGSPLNDYLILPAVRYFEKGALIYNGLRRTLEMNFRLCKSIPEKRTEKELVIVPHSPEFFDRLRIYSRVYENFVLLNEGLGAHTGIEISSTDGMQQEMESLLEMALFDSIVIYDDTSLDTSPEKRDEDALKALMRRVIKEHEEVINAHPDPWLRK